jgi:hypothetical protein
MNFAESLFFLLVLLSVLVWAWVLVRGGRRRTWPIVRAWLIGFALYAALLLATTLSLPIQVLTLKQPQYSGDWSITVTNVQRVPHETTEDFELEFRLANAGTKAIHAETHLTAYLLSDDGTRYDAAGEPSSPPFDAPLKPGQAILTKRLFVLPKNLNRVELVLAKEGFRIGWFVIGRTPFDGRTVVHLQ